MRPYKNLMKQVLFSSRSVLELMASVMLLTAASTPSFANTSTGSEVDQGNIVPAALDKDVNPNQTYQWVGKVTVSALEGRHLELQRQCDSWALLAKSDEVAKKLEANIGNKMIIWGKVNKDPTTFIRPTIMVDAAYGPNDPMPMTLVAIPEYPCPGRPDPVPPVPPISRDLLTVGFSQLAARGELVWENGKAFLVTPQGRIELTIPVSSAPGQSSPSTDANTTNVKMDVVAAGKWKLDKAPLNIAAFTVRAWQVGVLIGKTCTGAISTDKLAEGEAAARGTLVWDSNQSYLKTESGPIMLSFDNWNDLATARVLNDAVIVGKWKASESVLYISVRNVGNMQPECCPTPPPQPPLARPTLLAGEIASIGVLVWEGGRPYLETPSGKIYLKIAADQQAALKELQGQVPPADDTKPILVRPQVLAVGKWDISSGELVISVRHLQRWP